MGHNRIIQNDIIENLPSTIYCNVNVTQQNIYTEIKKDIFNSIIIMVFNGHCVTGKPHVLHCNFRFLFDLTLNITALNLLTRYFNSYVICYFCTKLITILHIEF